MFGLDSEDLNRICDVFEIFPQIKEVKLYGSRAKGTQKPGSDIDITLVGQNIDLKVLNEITMALDNLMLPYTFDISLFDQIKSQDLLKHIESAGKLIYQRRIDQQENS